MPRYPFSGPERQEAAREAVELQEGEKKAEGLLMPPAAIGDVAQTQPAGGEEQQWWSENLDLMSPQQATPTPQQATQTPGEGEILSEMGPGEAVDAYARGKIGVADKLTGGAVTGIYGPEGEDIIPERWGPREEHLTRDRSDLPLPQMSLQALKDARERLVVALATEPSGSQADAYTVLMGRIDREIAEQETPVAVTEEPAVEEQ
jgi:hypothetical protein